jgi:hypothetical protein
MPPNRYFLGKQKLIIVQRIHVKPLGRGRP